MNNVGQSRAGKYFLDFKKKTREPGDTIGRGVFPVHSDIPHLSSGVHLFDELGDLHVIELGIPAIGLGLHIV
jgi:hypothetical protein